MIRNNKGKEEQRNGIQGVVHLDIRIYERLTRGNKTTRSYPCSSSTVSRRLPWDFNERNRRYNIARSP